MPTLAPVFFFGANTRAILDVRTLSLLTSTDCLLGASEYNPLASSCFFWKVVQGAQTPELSRIRYRSYKLILGDIMTKTCRNFFWRQAKNVFFLHYQEFSSGNLGTGQLERISY